MKKFRVGAYVLVVLSLLVSACGGRSSDQGTVQKAVEDAAVSAQMRAAYIEASKVYTQFVRHETLTSADYQVWMEDYSVMLAGAGEQMHVVQECYQLTTDQIVQGAEAVFQDDGVAPAEQGQALVDAMVSGEGLYAGSADRCQEAALDLMQYLRTNRSENQGLRTKVIDELRVYQNMMRDDLERAAVFHFFNQYGPEIAQLVEQGEGRLLNAIAAENNLDPLPIDFIGFPTGALRVQTFSEQICEGYAEIYSGQIPAPGGVNPKLFVATWDPILGSCELSRQAALRYMSRAFLTAEASDRLDTGRDGGAFEDVEGNQ